jgi:hypothetical protein
MYNLKRVVRELDSIVEEWGEDFVYVPTGGMGAQCVYLRAHEDPKQERCIIGVLLKKLGLEVRAEWNGDAIEVYLGDKFGKWQKERFNDEALRFMSIVQRQQDSGISWGSAVKYAKESTMEEEISSE